MRSFIYTSLALNQGIKIVGRSIAVEVSSANASSLILYVAAGIDPVTASMTEITDVYGTQITRMTLNGVSSASVNIDGLTPGMYACVKTLSGTGTQTIRIITGE